MKDLAPVVLFAYNRPDHVKQTLYYLSQNILASQTTIIVYCDGAKQDSSPENSLKIKQVREIVSAQKWSKEIQIIESEINLGLANSIIRGVREVTEKYGSAIVLEDDLITSKYFLQYMNDALKMYANNQKVLSIGACNFFARDENTPETFFIPIPDCWGWATWKDRWCLFEEDGSKLLAELKSKDLINDFNLHGAYDFEQMLKDQIAGKNNSWAIRWQATAYLTGKLSLYPRFAQTHNIGFGEEATHTSTYKNIFNTKSSLNHSVNVNSIEMNVLPKVLKEMNNGYALASGKLNESSFFIRLISFLKRKVKIS